MCKLIETYKGKKREDFLNQSKRLMNFRSIHFSWTVIGELPLREIVKHNITSYILPQQRNKFIHPSSHSFRLPPLLKSRLESFVLPGCAARLNVVQGKFSVYLATRDTSCSTCYSETIHSFQIKLNRFLRMTLSCHNSFLHTKQMQAAGSK